MPVLSCCDSKDFPNTLNYEFANFNGDIMTGQMFYRKLASQQTGIWIGKVNVNMFRYVAVLRCQPVVGGFALWILRLGGPRWFVTKKTFPQPVGCESDPFDTGIMSVNVPVVSPPGPTGFMRIFEEGA